MRVLFLYCLFPLILTAQSVITIDGKFDDWKQVQTFMDDPANDEHDTDWFSDQQVKPTNRQYSDVDILQVKFTHDRENLYGYVKARGIIGRTARQADGLKAGRYYFIITIDVDDDDRTGYPLQEGNYWPNSTGYDMNMEVEFYDGSFNTGHYILHAFLGETELTQGRDELAKHQIRLAPGNYDDYLQWVVFPDSSFTYVSDRGPVIENGIIKAAVSVDGHEAEMRAPMWGFYRKLNNEPVVKLGNTVDISFSLEGSGELSEEALQLGYGGKKSLWGSDTAEPIVGYTLVDPLTLVTPGVEREPAFQMLQNYPNPFNATTMVQYRLQQPGKVQLAVYNLLGQQVAQLEAGLEQAGLHRVKWDGCDTQGLPLAGGVYLLCLQSQNENRMTKMVILR